MLDASTDEQFDCFEQYLPSPRVYDVQENEFPEDPDAVIVTGSKHGVYEDQPWIQPLLEKIREYVEAGIPLLGVCFGHQAIAKAFGGEIRCMGEYEIGYRKVWLEDSPIFRGLSGVERPFITHQDEVSEVPGDFTEIASNDVCLHGIEHRERDVFGVQFHPEYDMEYTERVIKRKDFTENRTRELIEQVHGENHRKAERTKKVLKNFIHTASGNSGPH